jgi:hypothetical protein
MTLVESMILAVAFTDTIRVLASDGIIVDD